MEKVKNILTKKKILIIILVLLALVFIVFMIFHKRYPNTLSSVTKITSGKYYDIKCINEDCDFIAAYKGSKKGKTKIYVYNSNGKKIGSYNEDYSSKAKYDKEVADASSNYIILKKATRKATTVEGYILIDKRGKELYSIDKELYALNDNIVYVKDDSNYTLLDKKGKTLYENVTDLNVYLNKSIISFTFDNKKIIMDKNGKSLLNGYTIVEEIKDIHDKSLYLIVQENDTKLYYYFDINKNKIVGEGFTNYTKKSNNIDLIISKKDNNKVIKSVLDKNGVQTIYSSGTKTDILNSLEKKINTKEYNIILDGVNNEKQEKILVDNKKDNSFGIYDLKNNKYLKLYDYKTDNGKTKIYELYSDDEYNYLQLGCSIDYCEQLENLVYEVNSGEIKFRVSGTDKKIKRYNEYTGGYKVVEYSISSIDNYSGLKVLYDKDNKELVSSNNDIIVLGEKLLFGDNDSKSSLLLYSTEEKELLNDDKSLATKKALNNNYIYTFYTDKNTRLVDEKGNIIKKIKLELSNLKYSDDSVLYSDLEKVYVYDSIRGFTWVYSLDKNENVIDNDYNVISPYKNSIYVSNNKDKYVKIINSKGKNIKKIKNTEIVSVNKSKETDKVIIITKSTKNKNTTYGLYIGK